MNDEIWVPSVGDRLHVEGELVTVLYCELNAAGVSMVVRRADGNPIDVTLTAAELAVSRVIVNDAAGDPEQALTGMWGRWMQYTVPRMRSAVLATRPLQPYAHQDEAVFTYMLAQPRLRFLLADEPGTGKTIMTGMYLAEGTRRGLIPGNTVIVVPAHLVQKWQRDLRRYFAIEASRLTPEIARDPKDLDPRVRVWVVSVDLYTYNVDVRRKVAGARASWSLAVFDEAHRLTPTSQYHGGAQELADRTHHLLLLTATPHRGKEHFFRALLHLLDPTLYAWDPRQTDYDRALRPSTLSFLRRMKEDLKDLDGNDLFPRRFAETRPVTLTNAEDAAYKAVMDYVDTYYGENATLARSIYGKRAASSLTAAAATIQRRQEALRGPANSRVDRPVPDQFTGEDGALNLDVDDDEAWQHAEDLLVRARSQNKPEELSRIDGVLTAIRHATQAGPSSKWREAQRLMAAKDIRPGEGQLLIFTEFTDTARWLVRQFADAGFTVETIEGAVNHEDRDKLQQRFLNREFQILVSTDAGGEGIDLQSAHVMINWDIPWSLVRLEQRMGRLHRIGQKNDVYMYHLVAPGTREGRVQEVMLDNVQLAGQALRGRIFDLLDATVARAGFDYTGALVQAQAGAHADVHVPRYEDLVASAKELAKDEDRLHTPTNTEAALARFRADRLEAINPVIVDGFLDQLARSEHWELGPGPAQGVRTVSSQRPLPQELGGGYEQLVAADGAAVRRAIADGSALDDVIILGPTEEPFTALVERALRSGETDLARGAHLVDTASLTGYTLVLYDAEVEIHDGLRRVRHKTPLLVRYSGAGAFGAAWESLMNLRAAPASTEQTTASLAPALRAESKAEADRLLAAEVRRYEQQRRSWVSKARDQLDQVEYRYLEELEELPIDVRRERRRQFEGLKRDRLDQLTHLEKVTVTTPRIAGWTTVAAGIRETDLGYDPDSEKLGIATVIAELERLDYLVDDRQTAGLGYDLLARHKHRGEQRLIEVKSFTHGLRAVWLEQHEWAQAQQRGEDYWLYVVTNCATTPQVVIRAQDPASKLMDGPRRIERFQITVADLKRLMEESQ